MNRLCSYDQYEECLREGVDAVYVTVPNHLHRDYTVVATEGGVHVLCEKPMAVTPEQCPDDDRGARVGERLANPSVPRGWGNQIAGVHEWRQTTPHE